MDDVTEAKFEQIIVDAIARAETLDPDMPFTDFYQGLLVMKRKLDERVDMARADAGVEPPDFRGFTF